MAVTLIQKTPVNARFIFPDERIYYLADDNHLGLSLSTVNVRESHFNCAYDDEILLITNRVENANAELESMVNNNPETFTKMQEGNLEYYYIQEYDRKKSRFSKNEEP